MDIRFENRDTFYVCGYSVETNEASLEKDVAILREKYEDRLREISPRLYFVSWITKDDNMIYHFSVETSDEEIPGGMVRIEVPAARFAVATVPEKMPVLAAWHDFFATKIPSLGATIDENYGIYFEFFNENGVCELWIPVVSDVF